MAHMWTTKECAGDYVGQPFSTSLKEIDSSQIPRIPRRAPFKSVLNRCVHSSSRDTQKTTLTENLRVGINYKSQNGRDVI